uniref:Uncharacterized protein n=1 Tax=Pristionchus pacificus TaxID=54126 RepID=A0A2A6BPL0_PRIPA|eukprot:PDM67766.1 hypothetical protein PRIPAC_45810 [Pristionchus pacificus]
MNLTALMKEEQEHSRRNGSQTSGEVVVRNERERRRKGDRGYDKEQGWKGNGIELKGVEGTVAETDVDTERMKWIPKRVLLG